MAGPPSPAVPPTRICVFCSTTRGQSPAHLAAARQLAQTLHTNNIHLIYGGATTGLMGELAKTTVRLSGPESVQGIIPRRYISLERPEDAIVARHEAPEQGKGWVSKVRRGFGRKKGSAGDETAVSAGALLSEDRFGRTTVVADVQIRKESHV